MKVIITGGAGFIGGHAVRHFVESSDDVLNIDKLTYASKLENTKFSKFIKLDIRETDILHSVVRDFSPDVIVNFAAETHVDNSILDCKEFIRSNLEGTTSVADVCRSLNIKLCHISTDEVHGPAGVMPFNENDRLNPMNPYSATKAAADMMLDAYMNTHSLDYVIVRPSNNYGAGQHAEKFIPKLLKCIKEEKKFSMYGLGDQEREWTYVEDTVQIIRKLLISNKTSWGGSIYNLSSGISSTNIDIAKLIIETYNFINSVDIRSEDVIQHSKDRPGHDKKYWIETEKIKRVVEYDYTTLKNGIEKIVRLL